MQLVVCALAKNEHLYIKDWCNHYLKLGFDKIYIYDNDDLDSESVKNYLPNSDKIVVYDVRGRTGKNMQHEIYTEFYNTHNRQFDWCLFVDIDEFLVGIDNVKAWLGLWYLRNARQIRIKWRLFGDDDLITRNMSVPVYKAFRKVITKSLCRNLKDKSCLENQGKMMVRGGLENVVIESPHFASYRKRENVIPSVLPSGKPTWDKVEIKTNYRNENIYINHYMTKTLSEFVAQKLNRNDAVFNTSIALDYYWRINEKTPKKIEWLKEKGLL